MRAILDHPDTSILAAAVALLAVMLGCGLVSPPVFGVLLAAAVVGGIAFLALRFPVPFCVVWLTVAGMSLEMALGDVLGGEAYQPIIAVVKGSEIGLALLCAVRYGPKLDLLCPAWAYLAMLAAGFVHGLYPGWSTWDCLRSAIGSITPFAFCFCRVPRSWPDAIIRATKWIPVIAVLACLPLTAAGIRPLFVESGGARLAGLGHPAFLGNVCLPAIYACLIQLYREGKRGDLMLLVANGLILLLTGARTPVFFAVVVSALCLVFVRSTVFAVRDRLVLVLAVLALLPVLALLAGALGDVRLFKVVATEATNLSGRDRLWPLFEEAASRSPWFGWGIGSANAVIPRQSDIVQLMHTWAAHNEYLRIGVEGGLFGSALLVGLFAAWVIVHTRPLWPSDRRIMRLVFVAYAGLAVTDNVLISTPACVMFAFAIAVFARGERDPLRSQTRLALPDSRLVA